ncbi:MAG TPA: S-formylglutathione hydrolase [Burkholderiales bacterium]|nr:S-formylglutathione hydrolase [Burkholderiales bacterium]
MKTISEHRCFEGVQGYYSHASKEIGLEMKFSVFVPPQAKAGKAPVLYYLAGLTCTEETFAIKAGAQRLAAELGLVLVAPDTSPRGANVPGEADSWDFGVGAGFYVDATREPWSKHYRMYSYVTRELPALVAGKFPVDTARQGIFGHSMGGHGALVCALRNPGQYQSLSAFAPIAAPMRCPWGKKAFKGYLGDDHETWKEYDASDLIRRMSFAGPILIDQGLADKFLPDQLYPEVFETACRESDQPLVLNRREGYDHGYFFISTFMENHLRHHADQLKR